MTLWFTQFKAEDARSQPLARLCFLPGTRRPDDPPPTAVQCGCEHFTHQSSEPCCRGGRGASKISGSELLQRPPLLLSPCMAPSPAVSSLEQDFCACSPLAVLTARQAEPALSPPPRSETWGSRGALLVPKTTSRTWPSPSNTNLKEDALHLACSALESSCPPRPAMTNHPPFLTVWYLTRLKALGGWAGAHTSWSGERPLDLWFQSGSRPPKTREAVALKRTNPIMGKRFVEPQRSGSPSSRQAPGGPGPSACPACFCPDAQGL